MLNIDLTILKNKDLDTIRQIFAPYTNRVYLVGGCVRDAFLKKSSVDFDIEVYDVCEEKFAQIMQGIKANGVGKSFFIYKFKNYDMGLARTENKTGDRHTDFVVQTTNDEKMASKRRDFRINSIMINIFNGKILDCWGGIDDIKNKIIRHIDDKKFIEDPLRVLRAIQFSSRFGFSIDSKTLNLMSNLNLDHLSKDRISTELIKFFKSQFLEVGLEYIYKLNLFKKLFDITPCEVEFDEFKNIVKTARKLIDDEHLFFYIMCGYFRLDHEKMAHSLRLPKSYVNLKKEPFFKGKITDYDILKVAVRKPLSRWLGCYDTQRVKRAKYLGVYDAIFTLNFNPQELVKLGFSGVGLKNEIERLTDKQIINFIKSKSV